MELTDLFGVSKTVLGLAQLYCDRDRRKTINQRRRLQNELRALKNVVIAHEIINARPHCLKSADLQELRAILQELRPILEELRAILEEVRALQQTSSNTQYPARLEGDALEVGRNKRSRSRRSQTTETPARRPGTRKQKPLSPSIIRKLK
jgi:hypothetical protein